MNTADRQSVICKPGPGGGVPHLPALQHVVGAVYVVPLIPQVPDGSLCDISQNSLAHDPSCPVEDRVAEAVRGEELPPGVGVERVHVVHHAPLLVEAPETVWLEGGGETRALNVNSRTQILQQSSLVHQNTSNYQTTSSPWNRRNSETSPTLSDH